MPGAGPKILAQMNFRKRPGTPSAGHCVQDWEFRPNRLSFVPPETCELSIVKAGSWRAEVRYPQPRLSIGFSGLGFRSLGSSLQPRHQQPSTKPTISRAACLCATWYRQFFEPSLLHIDLDLVSIEQPSAQQDTCWSICMAILNRKQPKQCSILFARSWASVPAAVESPAPHMITTSLHLWSFRYFAIPQWAESVQAC